MATPGQDTAAMDNNANIPGSLATTADQMAANNASDVEIDALPDRKCDARGAGERSGVRRCPR